MSKSGIVQNTGELVDVIWTGGVFLVLFFIALVTLAIFE